IVILDEFQVTTTADNDNYIATDTIGTRTAARLTETPFSIETLTSEFIEDFQLFELSDQLNFVAGAFPGSDETGNSTGKKIRGFGPPVLRDGFSDANPPHPSLIDRTEFIRGPAAALFGQSEPGGIINSVSKRATRRPRYSLSASYGPAYDSKRVSLNASSPVIPGKLFYFAGFAYNYNKSDSAYYFKRIQTYAVAVTYMPAPRTLFTLSLEKQPQWLNQGDSILFWQENIDGKTMIKGRADELSAFNTQGPNHHLKRGFECVNLLIEHRLAQNLVVRANLQDYKKTYSGVQNRLASAYVSAADPTFNVEPYSRLQYVDARHFGFDLNWSLRTGPVRHSFLAAGDYHVNESDDSQYVQPGPRKLTAINVYDPAWIPLDPYAITQLFTSTRLKTRSCGALLSYRGFFFAGRLVTFAAVRFDEVERPWQVRYENTTNARNNPLTISEKATHNNDTSSSFGANLKLCGDALVLYANFSTGFTASLSIDEGTGRVLPNETSKGVDAGFKGSLFGDRLLFTVSAYDIKKEGISIANDDYVAGGTMPQYLGDGVDKSRGFDGNIKWNATPGLFINVGAGCMDATTYSRRLNPATDRMTNTPRVNAYCAIRYALKTGPFKGLRLGGAATHQGDRLVGRETASRSRMIEPSVTLFSGFVGYGCKKGKRTNTVRLNASNLFNEHYYSSLASLAKGRDITISYGVSF
ncbi:MAG: TonB-dependent receptor plug domain-containing protein, partial [Opitutaceae bacterium]|nr:TonB-dependent receptor plug domain-containing protein [Opitutaceae bacterium]